MHKCIRAGCTYEKRTTVTQLGHNLAKHESSVAPTCTDAGTDVYKCIRAGCTYEQRITVTELGHNWKKDENESVLPTCTDAGTEVYYCERNHDHRKTVTVSELGHLWVKDTTNSVAPTCTHAGTDVFTCSRDATHTKTSTVKELGHTWDEGKITTAPTCSKAGVKTYTCTVCKSGNVSTIKTESIPATGEHKYTLSRDKNYHYIYCANAGCTETYSEPHTYGRWKVVRTATPEKKGVLKKVCKVCDHALWTNYEYTDNPPTKDFVLVPMALTLTTGAALAVLLAEKKRRRS